MKKLQIALGPSLALCLASVSIGAVHEVDTALRTLPAKVQGVDYRSTLGAVPGGVTFAPHSDLTPARNATNFSFDDIEFWAGEGSNRAGLMVQWNCDGEENALVFGYRWDGQATGADMLKAIAQEHPRFYALMQYTSVSSPTDPNGGFTINGLGWDADEDGDISLIDTGHGNQVYTSETGFFEHPRGYKPGSGGSSDYDYDNWIAGDKDDYWGAGWYSSYWSYWVGSDPNNLGYSNWGASGRLLDDGDWDGWNFAVDMISRAWKPLAAAPAVIPADVETDFVYEDNVYTLVNYKNSTVSLTAYKGNPEYTGEITIPSTFVREGTTYTVVSVGSQAFIQAAVTKVNLPATVTSIGDEAFKNSKVAEVSYSDAVKKLGKYAFQNAPITSVTIPAGVSEIPEGLCRGTAVTELVVPTNVTSIGAEAFADCQALTSVELHGGVIAIGEHAFACCNALKSVKSPLIYPIAITENVFSDQAHEEATLYVPQDCEPLYRAATEWQRFVHISPIPVDVPANTQFTLGTASYKVLPVEEGEQPQVKVSYAKTEGNPTFTTIKNANTEFYTGDVVIPSEISFGGTKYKVTALSDSCFFYAAATSITLPEGITEIPQAAFKNATVESIHLPSTITTLGKNAFDYCQKLTSIELPEGVTALPQYAFNYCTALKTVTAKSPIQAMEYYAFKSCTALEEAPALAEGMTQLPQAAFQDCAALKTLTLPSTLTTIGSYAFSGCKALVMDFPENVTSLGANAFTGCTSLTKVTVNDKITTLPNNAFKDCTALSEVNLPTNVKTLGNYVFANTGLTDYELPATVTTLGTYTFYGCKQLTRVVLPASIAKVPASTFRSCPALTTVQIKKRDLTLIDSYTFADCGALTTIIFGDDEPMAQADGEETETETPVVTIPSTVTKIADNAFLNCKSLRFNPVMPAKLTTLGNYAFSGCTNLTELELPEGFTTFGSYCFRNTGLTSLVVPSTVKTVATNTCNGATGLHLYFLSDTPATCYSSSFTYSSGKYVGITVPSGTAAAYIAKSTYWKNAKPVEPELAVEFGDAEFSHDDNQITVTAPHTVDYAEAIHPERFTTVNAAKLDCAEVTLRITPVVEEPTDEPEAQVMLLAENDNAVEFPATLNNGKLSATIEPESGVNDYTGTWVYNLGTTTKESEPFRIKVASSGIGSVSADGADTDVTFADGVLTLTGHPGANVAIVALDGRVVSTFTCTSATEQLPLSLPAATYIVVVGNSAYKIALN